MKQNTDFTDAELESMLNEVDERITEANRKGDNWSLASLKEKRAQIIEALDA